MLNDILRRQDGIVTAAQARRVGLGQDTVERRVRAGQWRRCAPGVYFVDDRPFTDAARIRAAVWRYGRDAAASGRTAAWWHGLCREAPQIVDVTIPRTQRRRPASRTRVRRRDLPSADIVDRLDLRVTAVALTVFDAGDIAVMDTALQRRWVTLAGLEAAAVRHRGAVGSPAFRRLLRAAAGNAHSEAERLLLQALRDAAIGGWRANHRVGAYVVDVAFLVERVAVEVDGWAFHTDRDTFQRDRTRQNALALLGWQVLRFTWSDIVERPHRVIAEIRAATAR